MVSATVENIRCAYGRSAILHRRATFNGEFLTGANCDKSCHLATLAARLDDYTSDSLLANRPKSLAGSDLALRNLSQKVSWQCHYTTVRTATAESRRRVRRAGLPDRLPVSYNEAASGRRGAHGMSDTP